MVNKLDADIPFDTQAHTHTLPICGIKYRHTVKHKSKKKKIPMEEQTRIPWGLYEHLRNIIILHSSVDGHLGICCNLAVVNSPSVIIGV